MGTGKQFGLRLSATVGGVATSGVPRCKLSRLSIGGSFDGAGDGPFNCLELDGAIVTTARNCLFSFSTGGSGIFIDTTQSNPPPAGKWSTNVNRFIQCTCNGNTEYGLKAIGGGIQGVSFVGGNIESNHTGAVLAQAVAGGFVLREVDFENDNAHTVENLITIEASVNPFVIEDCNFVTQNTGSEWNTIGTQSVTKRVIIVAGSHQGSIKRNRFAEFNPGNSVPLIVIGVDASNCEVENNNGFDVTGGHNNLIEHRGYWT
jgi:uncharacterized protein YcfJ